MSLLGSKFFNSVTGHWKFGRKKARALNHNMPTFHTTYFFARLICPLCPLSVGPISLLFFLELCLQTPTPGPLHLLPCLKYSSPWHPKGPLPGLLQVSLSVNLAKRPFLIITMFIPSNLVLPNYFPPYFLHGTWLLLLVLLLSPPHTWM